MSNTNTTSRDYDVVALSFPIVYSLDGDHDPNGMLYTLRAYVPLLDWARDRWEQHGEYLPRMHRRRQLMQIVVDGLPRYAEMRRRLHAGSEQDRWLLDDLGDAGRPREDEDPDDGCCPSTPHDRATRQNYRATVDDLVLALDELTGGRTTRLSASPEVRAQWLQDWTTALADAERAIAERLRQIDQELDSWLGTLTPEHTPLSREHVRRLLLNDHRDDVSALGAAAPPYDRFNPLRPVPLVRPLVLRACVGETVTVDFENQVRRRRVGMHLQGTGPGGDPTDGSTPAGAMAHDGAHVGRNTPSTVDHGQRITYRWRCTREGVWPVNDLGDVRGTERGTNVHGLFGALVVEPTNTHWYDPETGDRLDGTQWGDGLYADVVTEQEEELRTTVEELLQHQPPPPCPESTEHTCVQGDRCRRWREENFVDFHQTGGTPHAEAAGCSFREFTIFFHDEPEIHSGLHLRGEHSVMPLSYRAEPMHNRLPHRMRRLAARTSPDPGPDQRGIDHAAVRIELDEVLGERFWVARAPDGRFLERVSGEEQHHSSWLFGEPVTPVLRAYRGDPARIRLVHAGVKETHVFHLHVHQWHAVAEDTAPPSAWREGQSHGSQLLDSITLGPQIGMTIDPLYGSGSRQHAVGDIIWHCHLYPHFHHGMWGLWRSFDRLVPGRRAYPDGTPCPALQPLPGRVPDEPDGERLGFPWFVDATFPRKSPPPPALREEHVSGRRRMLEMPMISPKEEAACAPGCVSDPRPGALFVDLDGLARTWNDRAGLPEQRVLSYDVEVTAGHVEYNSAGWHDAHGHFYRLLGVRERTLEQDGAGNEVWTEREVPITLPEHDPRTPIEPFVPRANHGDVVELRLHNMLPSFPADDFDLPADPVECGLHVHLVKFDVLTADGSATGWNYLSGASCREAVGPNRTGEASPRNVSLHRWVVDEEFGPCFFHDHLLANYRQKRGLFAALIAEPQGSRWYLPDQRTEAWAGTQAVVLPDVAPKLQAGTDRTGLPPFRDACLAIGDFIPLYKAPGAPLNTPHELGGDDDPGAMGVNYRCTPLTLRGDDPSEWFTSSRHDPADEALEELQDTGEAAAEPEVVERSADGLPQKDRRDPDTPVIWTYPGERLRIRLIQGSHEEQHSLVLHGLRWHKDWHHSASTLVNQQTLGISEAFTLDVDPDDGSPYGVGDHLWQFAAMDDLWLGCWGLVRALRPSDSPEPGLLPLPPAGKPAPIAVADMRQVIEELREADRQAKAGGRPARAGEESDGERVGSVQEYVVVARRIEHHYAGRALTDPWGLIYQLADGCLDEKDGDGRPTGNRRAVDVHRTDEPLVLRANPGQWVHVTLINEVLLPEENAPGEQFELADPLLPEFGPETSPPPLPVESTDELGYPDERRVSPRVSLHPSLLLYDVVGDDGANVGHNHDGTVAALDVGGTVHGGAGGHTEAGSVIYRKEHGIGHRDPNWREYWWYVDEALLSPDGTGRVCYLQDMADVRNHRHHGLIGAVVVEPAHCPVPGRPEPSASGAKAPDPRTGTTFCVRDGEGKVVAEEVVVFLQDGLRQFLYGDPDQPVRDIVPGDDPEDAGQKGINYRTALVSDHSDPLAAEHPPTPVFAVTGRHPVWLRLVCAGDKPRNHTFTVHGVAWDDAPWTKEDPADDTVRPRTGAVNGISTGFTQDLRIAAEDLDPGDHAYRSGVFKWAVTQGLWGILRVDLSEGTTPDEPEEQEPPELRVCREGGEATGPPV